MITDMGSKVAHVCRLSYTWEDFWEVPGAIQRRDHYC